MSDYPFDTLRDSFLMFIAIGMSYEEAFEQFDEEEFRQAAVFELRSGFAKIQGFSDALKTGTVFCCITNDSRHLPALMELMVHADHEKANGVHGESYGQALDLWQAGWTSEDPNPGRTSFWGQTQVMSYYWRAPSKRPGKLGRRYLSTNQAHRAMKKDQT